MAQIYVPSASQQMIEDAVRDGLFLLRQDYQLKDSGGYYGRGGNVFGSVYAFGIKLKGGYCLSDRGVRPWEYDGDFEPYRQSHEPVMYRTYYRNLADTAMAECPRWKDKQTKELVAGKFAYVPDTLFGGAGFEIDAAAGKKAGWIVWVASRQSIGKVAPNTPASYIIYRKEIEVKEGVGEYAIDAPSTDLNVWGGIYVAPATTAVGQITFRLVGAVEKQGDGWAVFTPFGKAKDATVSGGKGGGLVPAERQEETETVVEEQAGNGETGGTANEEKGNKDKNKKGKK